MMRAPKLCNQESYLRNSRSRTGDVASAPGRRATRALSLALAWAVVLGACEKTTHENIDRWATTQKGPDKLKAALRDPSLELDLRAHAGQNLIRTGELDHVLDALKAMPAEQRGAVLAMLVPRLWEDARLSGELAVPTPAQSAAKDALFDLRGLAEGELLATLDGYLIDWLTGGYYAGLARTGRTHGEIIVRAVGATAGPKLVRSAKALLVSSAGKDGVQYKLEDPLLLGLAASGSPEAVGFLLDLLSVQHNDKELPRRAMNALYMGYIDNGERFDLADRAALSPHLDRLVRLAEDETRDSRTVNDVIRLIAAAGPPACVKPLTELMGFSHEAQNFLWVSANAALRCGKSQALVPVAEALPRGRGYALEELEGALLEPMIALDDKQAVAGQARALLGSESWTARVIGLELLGRLGIEESAAADAEEVRKLAPEKTALKGWWGDQSEVPKRARKADPTLGQRAEAVAKMLDQLSKSSEK
jgi:hypothetical protein